MARQPFGERKETEETGAAETRRGETMEYGKPTKALKTGGGQTTGRAALKRKRKSSTCFEKEICAVEKMLRKDGRNQDLLKRLKRLEEAWAEALDREEGCVASKEEEEEEEEEEGDCVYHLVENVSLGEMDDASLPILTCNEEGVVTGRNPIRIFSDAEETLHLHQKDAFLHLSESYSSLLPCCLLSIPPGAGKTLIALSFLDALSRVSGRQSFSVIVAPKSVLSVWKAQHAQWRSILPSLPPLQDDYCAEGPGLYLVNPDVLEHLPSRPYTLLIADELHGYCNPSTNAFQQLRSLPATFKVGMSGTFFKTDTKDYLHAILSLLPEKGPLHDSVDDLRRRSWTETSSRSLSRMLSPLLHECVSTVSAVRLPPLEEVTLAYPVPPSLVDFPVLDVKVDSDLKNNLVPSQREWISFLKSHLEGRKIFVVQRKSLVPFDKPDENEFYITGSECLEARQKAVLDFKGREDGVLYLTDAALEGIDLSFCSNVVLVGERFNPALMTQAICRCHRHGQTKPVLALRLIARAGREGKEGTDSPLPPLSASAEWRQYKDGIRKVCEAAAVRGLSTELVSTLPSFSFESSSSSPSTMLPSSEESFLPPLSSSQTERLSSLLPSLPDDVLLVDHNPVRKTDSVPVSDEEALSESLLAFGHGKRRVQQTRFRAFRLDGCDELFVGPRMETRGGGEKKKKKKGRLLELPSPGIGIDPSSVNKVLVSPPFPSFLEGGMSGLVLLADESTLLPLGVGRLVSP